MTSSKSYFDNVSGDWDRMRQQFFPEAVREKAYEMAGAKAGMTAADIGAGTGFVTEGLLALGLSVAAVDQSPEMLAVLKEKLGSSGVLTCLEGTAEQLPLDDSSVDVVLANMYLHHVEEPEMAIGEMVRVLAPGGRLVITDLDTHENEFLSTEQHDRWLGFERDDIRRWFEAAGLADVVIDCVGADCCADSSCSDDQAAVSIFAAVGAKPVI
jgi:ubiquinone/menaquinone biosynthesis C-methylase UbiE